ncbi:hypothetical protein TruAng_001391 [Truncatella angustata]|nr:hypothetical protein TruAng_001391 [Truncatella angustata]
MILRANIHLADRVDLCGCGGPLGEALQQRCDFGHYAKGRNACKVELETRIGQVSGGSDPIRLSLKDYYSSTSEWVRLHADCTNANTNPERTQPKPVDQLPAASSRAAIEKDNTVASATLSSAAATALRRGSPTVKFEVATGRQWPIPVQIPTATGPSYGSGDT